MKKLFLSLLCMCSAALVGCGGGSGGSESAASNPPPPAPSFTGSIAAPLNTSNGIVTIYQWVTGSGISPEAVTQESHGAITQFANCRMTGDYGAKEISGDSWYAMGRWDRGIRECTDRDTGKVASNDVSSFVNGSIHYLVVAKQKAALANYNNGSPVSCTNYAATLATLVSGNSISYTRNIVISNGVMMFDALGNARVEFDVSSGAGSDLIKKTYDAPLPWSSSTGSYMLGISGVKGVISRGFGPDGIVMLGSHGGDGVIVGGTIVVDLSGSRFLSAFSMLCH